jgi:hypothetical protein
MPAPDPKTYCVHLDENGFDVSASPNIKKNLADLGITFPGGSFLQATGQRIQQTPAALLGQLNTALMPLQPIFFVIDVAITLKDVLDAIKTLNPVSIGQAVAKIVPKIEKLVALVPQASVPIMILNCIDVIIAFLQVTQVSLRALVDAENSANSAQAKASEIGGDAGARLSVIAGCGLENVKAGLGLLQKQLAPVNRLIALLNLVGGIVSLPQIPTVGGASAGSAAEMLPILDTALSALTVVRGSIPL